MPDIYLFSLRRLGYTILSLLGSHQILFANPNVIPAISAPAPHAPGNTDPNAVKLLLAI